MIDIYLNTESKKAMDLLENSTKNVFITGKAGTGKSTLLKYFRERTEKNVAVVAPTGIAALNVEGQTIHSFFHFTPATSLSTIFELEERQKTLYEKLETLVIDEISMVRADLLDCIDKFLRINRGRESEPFGGVQVVFIGDLYQLPPVLTTEDRGIYDKVYSTAYFYGAKVFENLFFQMEFIELNQVYRQIDQDFIELLNAFRNNSVTEYHINKINSQVDTRINFRSDLDNHIILTPTNKLSELLNSSRMAKLDTPEFAFNADIVGDFPEKAQPVDPGVRFKVGCRVMFLNNDKEERWINGTLGTITTITTRGIMVKLDKGNTVDVGKYAWTMHKLTIQDKRFHYTETGHFIQYPLKLAWAVTIHKSQGKTFDKVILDIGNGTFAHGQLYVALSRCTNLAGIVLRSPIKKSHIILDSEVVKFVESLRRQSAV